MSRYRQPYSIYKRGKYWYYRTYDSSGKRTVPKSTGLTSKNAAKQFLNELYKTNSLCQTEITFGKYAAHFLDSRSPFVMDRVTKLTENTLHQYRNSLNNHLMPVLKDTKLADINYSALKQLRVLLLKKGLAPSSVTSTFSLLKRIIITAYKDNLIIKNPFEGLESLGFKNKPRDAFKLEEIKMLVKEVPDYANIILLMALTGMRFSEANGVRLCDVKDENGILYIDLKKQLLKHKYEPLKNKQSRKIPITEDVKNLILSEEISSPRFYRLFVPAERKCDNAAARNLCSHSLRHFFITNAKAKGINHIKVEKIAGHSLKGIQEVYTNFSAADLAEITSWQTETFALLCEKQSV